MTAATRRVRATAVTVPVTPGLFLGTATHISAQQASVSGVVTDATRGVLPGATMTATSLETGIQTVAVSDERGEYRFPALSPEAIGIPHVFNHANNGSYNTSLGPTSATTTALFGTPSRNTGTAFVPRVGQLAFRLAL